MESTIYNSCKKNNRSYKSTDNNESSDNDRDPQRGKFNRCRPSPNTMHPLYLPMPGYFPFYPLGASWPSMNNFYPDLLTYMSLESERKNIQQNGDEMFLLSLLKHFDANNNIAKEKLRSKNYYGYPPNNKEDCGTNCSHVCKACTQRFRCSCCSHPLENRGSFLSAPDCKCCHLFSDSCPALHENQSVPLNQCHYQCKRLKQPCHSVSQSTCGHIEHTTVPVDIPVRETPELNKCSRKVQKHKKRRPSDPRNESDLDSISSEEPLRQTASRLEREDGFSDENHSIQHLEGVISKNSKENDCESGSEHSPNYFGGTGDESTSRSIEDKQKKVHPPQSTRYFLSMSSLDTRI